MCSLMRYLIKITGGLLSIHFGTKKNTAPLFQGCKSILNITKIQLLIQKKKYLKLKNLKCLIEENKKHSFSFEVMNILIISLN